jgi:hypothetical protein
MTMATLGALGIVVFICGIVFIGLGGGAEEEEDGSAFVVFSAGWSVKLFFCFLFGKHIVWN